MEVIVRRLLEAAQAKCGAPPHFVKSAKVIRQALTAADDLSLASRRALANETNELTPPSNDTTMSWCGWYVAARWRS